VDEAGVSALPTIEHGQQPSTFLIDHGVSGCWFLARRAAQELPVCVSHRTWGDHPNTPKSPEGGEPEAPESRWERVESRKNQKRLIVEC
jgi:hypothetical protein